MLSLIFFGGVDEIGGNKIQINGPESIFFFDFGMGFSRANEFLL
jgi:ribonuclease J